MACMIPASLPSDATSGERRVYEALAHLSDDYAAYYRHLFPGRRHVEEPGQIEAEAARLLYVGMTRARDLLYVTYRSG